ncbi:MAG: hypothetical protein ACTSXT_01275, partial [Candidatus Helarchaeota archaeon]
MQTDPVKIYTGNNMKNLPACINKQEKTDIFLKNKFSVLFALLFFLTVSFLYSRTYYIKPNKSDQLENVIDLEKIAGI